jgi:hypothetical protein
LLDISHQYLTVLESEIFPALPELIVLNLSFNSFSTLNMTVMPQLAKVSSSVDLNGNPWVCDCLMFNTVYPWCRDNSVDLDLVFSSLPEFKDTPSTIYDEVCCFDFDYITNNVEEVEGTVMNIDKFHPKITYEGYEYNGNFEKNENSLPKRIEETIQLVSKKSRCFVCGGCGILLSVPRMFFVVFVQFLIVGKLNKIQEVY